MDIYYILGYVCLSIHVYMYLVCKQMYFPNYICLKL